MPIRDALSRSALLTFGLLLAALWLLTTALQVFGTMDLTGLRGIGQGAFSGIVGLAVLAIAIGLAIVLFGEVGEDEPGPQPWPPSE